MADKLAGDYLVAKLREQRLSTVTVGSIEFRVRRPTDVDMMELRGRVTARTVLDYVEGWEGVTEIDVIGSGGAGHLIEFSKELAAEWLADRPDLLGPIIEKVGTSFEEHSKKLATAKKK